MKIYFHDGHNDHNDNDNSNNNADNNNEVNNNKNITADHTNIQYYKKLSGDYRVTLNENNNETPVNATHLHCKHNLSVASTWKGGKGEGGEGKKSG